MKVLVDSATRNSSLAIIRGLAEQGFEVIGADKRQLPFNAHSCFTKPYLLSPADKKDYIPWLLATLEREKPDVFFPGTNIRSCIENRAVIQEKTRLLVPLKDAFETAYDKNKTVELCQSTGISCPVRLSEQQAIDHLKKQSDNKVVVKPGFDIGGSRGLTIVKDEADLSDALVLAARNATPLIQEYVPGPSSNMRTVNLMFDRESRLAAYFTTRKYREWPSTGGITVLSESTDDRQLVDWLLPLFAALHWQGPAEVEIKIDARTGDAKLIEINPRFCGYIGFAIECGVNMAAILCELVMQEQKTSLNKSRHEPSEQYTFGEYKTGVKYIHYPSFTKMALHTIASSSEKIQTVQKLYDEWRGSKVGNNLSWRDWKVVLMKSIFQLYDKGDEADVWH